MSGERSRGQGEGAGVAGAPRPSSSDAEVEAERARMIGQSWSHKHLLPRVLTLLPRPPARVVDFGSGTGLFTAAAVERGFDVVGIEPSDERRATAARIHPSLAHRFFASADDADMNGKADVVLCVEVIEHVVKVRSFLREIHRVLRPGGTLVITTPYHGYWKNLAICLVDRWDHHHDVTWEEGHLRFFSPRTLTGMLREAGFSEFTSHHVGRVPYLWTSMILRARRDAAPTRDD